MILDKQLPAIDVSIVIVNWNTRLMLLDCLRSLKEQTVASSIEVIVVDNGSTDGSVAAVNAAFPDVTMIVNPDNRGFSRANNQGIAVSRGRYVCLVNSDIKVLDSCVDKMVGYMESHHDIGLLGPRTVSENMQLRQNCRRFPSLSTLVADSFFLRYLTGGRPPFTGRTLRASTYLTTHDAEVVSGCFLMARRTAMESVGLLDERFFIYGEDVDWCKRFHDARWRIVFFADAYAIHYGGASSAALPARFAAEMQKSEMQYWLKHHAQASVTLFRAIKVLSLAIHVLCWPFNVLLARPARIQAQETMRGYIACLRVVLFPDLIQERRI
ncbi:MAG: glycosyltransferase family 2 protein [Chitinispirillaceae bacterium]|nr:glycosyltransferase family 2 protein [Chitinispirillaceae bacterium]